MSLKTTILNEDFLKALSSLQSITSKKGTMAILSNVLIQSKDSSLELIGTDLEVGIKLNIPAEIHSEGSVSLPAKKIFEIVRESGSDSITLEESDNNWVKITAGSSVYNLAGTSGDEYPDFPEYAEENLAKISSDILKDIIDKTIYSVAQERESNYTLTGLLLEKEEKKLLRMVSSDGHRLSIMEEEGENNLDKLIIADNTIIPKKGVGELKKISEGASEILLGFDKKQVVAKQDDSVLIVRLMNGDFPDYKSILKVIDRESFIQIERIPLLESLKRTNLFTEDTFNAIKFEIKKDKLILSSSNMDFGNAKDEIDIKYDGEEISLGFNCKYFIETLNVMGSDVVKVFINSDQSPCLISSDEDEGFSSIIMPMKI